MNTIRQTLTDLLTSGARSAELISLEETFNPCLQLATQPQYGDYQANFALSLAKVKRQKPSDLAKAVIDQLKENKVFKKLEVSGPGFINIQIADEFLVERLRELARDERLGIEFAAAPEVVVVDYGGANIAKEMHIGHLRSAVIGDAVVRILSFLGHQVLRQNHLGDWGTQFGMLIEYLISEPVSERRSYADLNILYQKAKQKFDQDPEFAERARLRVVALQQGEVHTLALWKDLVQESLEHFQLIYQRLGVLLAREDACGESFYNDRLPDLVEELKQKDLAQLSDGAWVIYLEGFLNPQGQPLPLMIQKSDGGFLYATTDLAAVYYRIRELHATRLIYVTDARQKQHFAMIFAAARKANWVQQGVRLEHLPFGSILGPDNKPFKTRTGEAIRLIDVLDEAEKRALEIAKAKHTVHTETVFAEDIARAVGIGAIKYADLRTDKIKDYVFDWQKILSFEGNTAPYLQNAYVRIRSIFRKSQLSGASIDAKLSYNLTAIEHTLAVHILSFPDLLYSVAEDLALHRLCEYLYEIASLFHKFYEECPILSENEFRPLRLLICELVGRILELGLYLLGVEVIEKM